MSFADRDQVSAVEEPLRPCWSRSLGSRAFQFDAFLSHNQADNSDDLAAALRRAGANVWRDDDSDMRDQRVRDRINKAINASRYLVVCVGPTFRDSEWVRAEYVPALLQARSHGFERIVVAKAASGSLPDELEICRLFEWDNSAALAEFVSLGNRLPFAPEQLLAKLPRPKVVPNLDRHVRADLRRWKETIKGLIHERALSHVDLVRGTVCATCLNAVEHPSRFQDRDFMLNDELVPRLTKSIADLASLDPDLLRSLSSVVRFLAWNLADSPMTGMRACALHMLFAVTSVWTQEPAALADLLAFLAHEASLPDSATLSSPAARDAAARGDLVVANGDVIAEAVSLYGFDVKSVIEWVQSADLIQTEMLCVLQLTAMRATFPFRSATLAFWVAALPECVRARVFAEAVVGEHLSRLEQTRLLRGRLDLVLKEGRLRVLHGERHIAGPVEQEIIQVLDLMRSQREEMPTARRSDAGSLADEVFALFESLISCAETSAGWPLTDYRGSVLDEIIKPIWELLLEAEVASKDRATKLLDRALSLVADSSITGGESFCYQLFAESLKEGTSFNDAQSDALFCKMAIMSGIPGDRIKESIKDRIRSRQ